MEVFLFIVKRWKMNIADSIVQETLKKWVKAKRRDVVVEIHMEDFDYTILMEQQQV